MTTATATVSSQESRFFNNKTKDIRQAGDARQKRFNVPVTWEVAIGSTTTKPLRSVSSRRDVAIHFMIFDSIYFKQRNNTIML